ncbi:MAG: hypothetical protein ACE5I4_06425 [Thermoplasmata archaeon]
MSGRWIWWEATALLLGLVLVQGGLIFLELRTSLVQDWFVTLAPLVWLNASILVLYLFFRQLAAADLGLSDGGSKTVLSRRLFRPRFHALRRAFRPRAMKVAVALIALGYGILFAVLQGILVLSPNTVAPLGPLLIGSPLGYGPALVWAPTPAFGLLLRPYTVAAAVALAVLSGVVLALFIRIARRDRPALTSLTGPLAGLAVLCPACFATPVAGLLAAYLAPAVTLIGLGTGAAFTLSLGLATVLLLASLILLWATVAWLSRLLPPNPTSGSNARDTQPRIPGPRQG